MKFDVDTWWRRLVVFTYLWLRFRVKLFGNSHLLDNFQLKQSLGQTMTKFVPPHGSIVKSNLKLNILPKSELFMWKLVKGKIPTRET